MTLDSVTFRYRPKASPVLNGVTVDAAPGEVIGIVGRSGSGKSTLTRLVQRRYTPDQGRVLVDGIDISLIDAAQLRRQVGVVLQENLLFNRSVRENIAISDPAAPIERKDDPARAGDEPHRGDQDGGAASDRVSAVADPEGWQREFEGKRRGSND